MISRRTFLTALGGGALGSLALSSYAFAIEPRFRLDTATYRFRPSRWPEMARPLRVAIVADLHACEPWMPLSRIHDIVEATNALKPDLTLLLGDYVAGLARFRTAVVPVGAWSEAFSRLTAPLGIYAVLGNHDWWTNAGAVRAGLERNGITVFENQATRLTHEGHSFWLAGLGDQLALRNGRGFKGVDDVDGTLRQIPDDGAPILLMAHEPDVFPRLPERVSLTFSGHTHGGQVALPFIGRPVVPSRYGERYAYGHIVEGERALLVSGGLGCSVFPVRFGVPPEIVLAELG